MNFPECKSCLLHCTRDEQITGTGTIPADLLFIGESPDIVEDTLGELLINTKIKFFKMLLSAAFKKSKLGVEPSWYYTNMVLCRPCDTKGGITRLPTKQEILTCSYQNIKKIVDIVSPKKMILLGDEVEKYYKGSHIDTIKLYSIDWLLSGGGTQHPFYLRSVNILKSVFNDL